MKKPARGIQLGATAAALLMVAGCQDQSAAPQKPLVRVRAIDAAPKNVAPVAALTGVIAAQTESSASFRTGGRIAERMVDVGDHVGAGQVLARIDPAEQQSDIRSAQAQVDAAQAQVTQTQAAFQRQQSLLSRGFTTRRDFDQARQAADVAKSSLSAAQTQLENAQDALGYTELKAEKAGMITARNVEAGQVVQAAQTVYTIADDGGRDAVFFVSETISSNPPPSLDVKLTLIGEPQVTAIGKVREVAPVIDTASGTIRVKVGIENPPPQMQLGAAVAGMVTLGPTAAVELPWQALTSDKGKPAVWTIDRATGAVALTDVDVLTYNIGSVAIRSGLSGGEQVVVAGGQLLRPGLVVEVVPGAGK